jgi:hypothetical protein
METKICSKCKIEKDIKKFPKDKRAKHRLACWCKDCHKKYREQKQQKIIIKTCIICNNKFKTRKKHKKCCCLKCSLINKQKYQNEWYIQNKKTLIKKQKEYYQKNKDKILEYRIKNKDKIQKQNLTYKRFHKKEAKNKQLQKKYNITLEKYNKILDEQHGVCAICGKKEPLKHFKSKQSYSLSVDHNHKTGKVRGLLCSNCNFIIGHSREKISVFQQAIIYLRKYK